MRSDNLNILILLLDTFLHSLRRTVSVTWTFQYIHSESKLGRDDLLVLLAFFADLEQSKYAHSCSQATAGTWTSPHQPCNWTEPFAEQAPTEKLEMEDTERPSSPKSSLPNGHNSRSLPSQPALSPPSVETRNHRSTGRRVVVFYPPLPFRRRMLVVSSFDFW